MKRAAGMILLALSLAGATVGPARAAPEDLANEIAAEIMSPFCRGVTLENCPSDRAVELRARIQSWAAQGWDKERILAELEDQFGRSIRAVPPKSGAGLWAWLAPGLAVLAGLAVAVVLTRRWTKRGRDDTHAGGPPVAAGTRARLNDELDALRGRP